MNTPKALEAGFFSAPARHCDACGELRLFDREEASPTELAEVRAMRKAAGSREPHDVLRYACRSCSWVLLEASPASD